MNLFQKFTLRIVLFCFKKRIKELNSFLFDVTQRIELFFQFDSKNCLLLRNITRWIESFFFFSILLKDLSLFSHNMTFKNWTFLKNMTQRIEPSFSIWLKELNLFLNMTHRNFLNYNSKNCFLQKYDSQNSKNWTFFSQMTRRLDFSFSNMSDRNNLFF